MKIDAFVLAGAKNNGRLREISDVNEEALIPIHGRPMLQYVLDALQSSNMIGEIAVGGPEELRPFLPDAVTLVPAQGSFSENVQVGAEYYRDKERTLLVTSDIPFLHKEAVEDFLQRCADHQADVYYPIVSKEANDQRFPGVTRTYFTIREGVFTGGNMLLIHPQTIIDCAGTVQQVVELRKKPLKMFQLLGPLFILRFLFRRLSLPDVEKRVQAIFGVNGKGIISPYPEIGTDVDKPSDWHLACRELSAATAKEAEGGSCAGTNG